MTTLTSNIRENAGYINLDIENHQTNQAIAGLQLLQPLIQSMTVNKSTPWMEVNNQ